MFACIFASFVYAKKCIESKSCDKNAASENLFMLSKLSKFLVPLLRFFVPACLSTGKLHKKYQFESKFCLLCLQFFHEKKIR